MQIRLGPREVRLWLVALAVLSAVELVVHTGARNGFLASSRPEHSGFDTYPAEGYVSWLGEVPVLLDAEGILKLGAFMLGTRASDGTGILDRRAGYAYLSTLTIPAAGAYPGYLVLNWFFWWAAAAALFWLVRQRWGDDALALGASFLVATAQGFVFMAGVPMSYLAAYSMLTLLLALAERLGAFTPRAGIGTWLWLGWGAGVASTLYFTQYVVLFSWWLYGLRRVPWRYLITATAVTFGISASWEFYGATLGGLGFATDNSSAVNAAFGGWASRLGSSWLGMLSYLRIAAVKGTLIGAFPYPWWGLAAVGFWLSSREDREWALSLLMAGLIPAILLLALLPIPRAAFYMYPAMAVLAARGALCLGSQVTRGATAAGLGRGSVAFGVAATVIALALPAAVSSLDLLGTQWVNTNFHFSTAFGW